MERGEGVACRGGGRGRTVWPIGGVKRKAEGGEGSAPLMRGGGGQRGLASGGRRGRPSSPSEEGRERKATTQLTWKEGQHDARETQSNTSKYGGVGSALRMRGSG